MKMRQRTPRQRKRAMLQIIILLILLLVVVMIFRAGSRWANNHYNVLSSEAKEETRHFDSPEDEVYVYFREAGYSFEGTCGIMGNLKVENESYDPTLKGADDTTYGLFQWRDNTDNRIDGMKIWCEEEGYDDTSILGQVNFALYELDGGNAEASRAQEALMKADDPRLAAQEFAVGFYNCIGRTYDEKDDAPYVGTVYTEDRGEYFQKLNLRMDAADEYVTQYQDYEDDYSSLEK